jgi:hypothetical protein
MKKEDKDLLLRDLCARLPYGVKCYKMTYKPELAEEVICILKNGSHNCVQLGTFLYKLEHIKPYLFPLSSMTSKQKTELSMLVVGVEDIFKTFLIEVEFYHKHHIDYRGLIPMGLAIDATGLNIY